MNIANTQDGNLSDTNNNIYIYNMYIYTYLFLLVFVKDV